MVREDPEIELELFEKFKIRLPIFVGSGGCTALSIAQAYPNLNMTLIEPNRAQIEHIQRKIKIVTGKNKESLKVHFSIGTQNTIDKSLIECGNFESLFRQFRFFLYEFVLSRSNFLSLFKKNSKKSWMPVFKHPYWSVAFEMFFSDAILRAMFGNAAIQHAPKGSYPRYFKKVIEQGLLRNDSSKNYFLHHIFLGCYLDDNKSLPVYLRKPPRKVNIRFVNSMAEQVQSYGRFDFVGLSNIFDWSSERNVSYLAGRLSQELKAGSLIVFRQLNNNKKFTSYFEDNFIWQKSLAKNLFAKDRSLFYSALHIGVKK